MKKIYNNKGITLISIIAYIILTLLVIGILGTITNSFKKNISGMSTRSLQDTQFDKINLQLLRETKDKNNEIKESESTSNKIVFSNGNSYTYQEDEQAVYLNDNIKIAENIESCNFEIDISSSKQTLTTTIQVLGTKRITEYTLRKEIGRILVLGNKAKETTTYKDKNGDIATIPGGFTVSGVPTESTIDGGLVIYLIDDKTDEEISAINWEDAETVLNLQKTYDQFVWIPIPRENINNMYICQAKTADNGQCNIVVNSEGEAECQAHKEVDSAKAKLMAGRLYAAESGGKFEQGFTEVYIPNTGLREPDVVTDDNKAEYLGQLNGILSTTYTTANDFKTDLQTEYNEIVKSVYENQGFYIGRYETSGMANSDTNATVKVVSGTTTGINSVTWYRMYAQQKKYAENKSLTSVKSTMIQGAAYDQAMKFVESETYNVKIVSNVEHSFSSAYNTGSKTTDMSKNIYDLEGNVSAWTTEASDPYYRVSRRR